MRAFNIIVILICGFVGLWGGYWLGHVAGWSKDADWPGQIGGGTGAMVVSVIVAIVGIAIGTALISLPAYRTTRRLLREGAPTQAIVLKTSKAELTLRSRARVWDKVRCQLEARPEDGAPFKTKACQFMSAVEEKALIPDAIVGIRYDQKRPGRAAIEEFRQG